MRFYYCLHIHVIPIERKMIKLILVKHLYVGSLRNVVGSRIRERSGAMAGASCYRRRESLLECLCCRALGTVFHCASSIVHLATRTITAGLEVVREEEIFD